MCFAEFIAYTCGHTSTAVNRPCPMTTHLYNNPCCSRPACRPFLAQTMCYPCSRIIHARRIDILEYEHRWMHERGACGCDVQFPALMHPRLVQRSSASVDNEVPTAMPQTGTGTGTGTGAGYNGTAGRGHFKQRSSVTTTGSGGHRPEQAYDDGLGEQSSLPLFKEAHVGENVEVAVRLASLYGAEWTTDHAKLHRGGRCKCPVSFKRYQPMDIKPDQDEHDSHEAGRSGQAWVTSYAPLSSDKNGDARAPAVPASSGTEASSPGHSSIENSSNPFGYDRIPFGQFARWSLEGPKGSLLDEILGPLGPGADAHGGRPMDFQSVHYPSNSLPIAGSPIAYGSAPHYEGGLPSIVEFEQPEATIAGFPIGAGPEGESHAGDFEACSLRSNSGSEGGSPVRMRRLSSEF
ncbi:hypothetical protein F4802DRAFT_213644 [Xylaria palmicola]|nr:hypothetical protein F4802DRAFT_213644 [Xylaria palmicola]